jgi:hypothetical protein
MFKYLEMTGNLLAVSKDPSVPPDGVLNQFVTTAKSAVEHTLLSTHRWPSDKSCVLQSATCTR